MSIIIYNEYLMNEMFLSLGIKIKNINELCLNQRRKNSINSFIFIPFL